MTTQEIIGAIESAGAMVFYRDGQPRLRGDVPEGVLAAIRADKPAFLEAWSEYERNRYGTCPPTRPLRDKPPQWREDVYKRVEGWISRQGGEVMRWVLDRALAYLQAGMKQEDATKAAMADVLYWQLGRHEKPEEVLEGCEQAAMGFRK